MRTSVLSTAAIVGVVLATALGGCKSDPLDPSFKSITGDLTPELQTLTERPVDVDRNIATTFDQNGRMFWMDIGRALYVDRPSYLSPYYIVPTGGQPR